MKDDKNDPKKKPGRKGGKVRSHLSLAPTLDAAAKYLGERTFGSKTTYLEHLIMKDLERLNLTPDDVAKLAEEWLKKNK